MVDQEPGKIFCVQLFSYALWCQNWECCKLLLGWNHQVCEDAAVVVIFLPLHGTQWFTESQVRFCVCSCFTCLFGVRLKVLKLLLGCDCWGSELQCYWWCCIFLFPLALEGSPRARWDFVYATVSWSPCWAGTVRSVYILVLICSFLHQKSEVHWEPGEILSLQLFSCICAVKVKICWSGTTKSLMRTRCNNNVRSCCSQWVKAQDLGLRGCRFESWFGWWVIPLLSP